MLADGDARDVPVVAREGHEQAAERDVRRHLFARALVELVDLREWE